MITEKNLVRHELIGLDVKVELADNKNQIGIEGKVIDETRDTLKIDQKGEAKIIPKKNTTFIFQIPSEKKVRVKGNVINTRPEDRISKKFKKW